MDDSSRDRFDLLIIREFTFPDDYEELFSLWQNAGEGIQLRQSDEITEIQKKVSRDPDLFLLAEWNKRIIGSVIGGFDGRRGMVYHLAVKRDYRKRGIGTALMNALEKRLRLKGCIRYYMLVTKDNLEAQKFYQGLGWKRMDLFAYGKDIE